LELERVEIESENLSLTDNPFSLELSRPGVLRVVVTEAALTAFLNHRAPAGMRDFKATLGVNRIFVEGVAVVMVPVKVKAECGLAIRDRKQLVVELHSVDVAGLGAKGLVRKQIEQINPVFDIGELPLEGALEAVQIGDGLIKVRGTLEALKG